jgi:hypothetical protein
MSYRTAESIVDSLDGISAERLIELAEAGYVLHYMIDGKGPWFKSREVKAWYDANLVTAHAGMPLPMRLMLVIPPQSRPASDAPESIARLNGLRHIDPAYFLCPGVYFLCRGDEVVDVGQSVNIPGRIMDHVRESSRPAGKRFDRAMIFYLPTPESELLRVESEFIRLLQPEYNNGTSRSVSPARARRAAAAE